MTVATVQISESLQTLIDNRLDTIDRMLLGRLSRQDRLAIAREVESQIYELLQEPNSDEFTREDVLAVLARLDPPEAYLPDEADSEHVTIRRSVATPTPTIQPALKAGDRIARISGILGMAAITLLLLLLPMTYLLAIVFQSEIILFGLGGVSLVMVVVAAFLAFVLGILGRNDGNWAIAGIVTGGDSDAGGGHRRCGVSLALTRCMFRVRFVKANPRPSRRCIQRLGYVLPGHLCLHGRQARLAVLSSPWLDFERGG